VIAVGQRDSDYRFLPSRGIRRQYSLLRKLKESTVVIVRALPRYIDRQGATREEASPPSL
jgi:hypothetical protein